MFRYVLAGLLPVLLSASAEAQTPPIITETEFLSVLEGDHPAVTEQVQDLALARAQAIAAATLENPTLGAEREDPQGPGLETTWTLSWQIPDSSRGLEIDARQQAVEAAEARLSQNLASLRLQMRQVYAEWAVAAARRDRLSAQADRVEALAVREARRAEKGEASGLEARRLGLASSSLEAKVALAAAEAEAARGRAMSWYPDLPPSAEPALPALLPAPKAPEAPPLLRAAQSDLEASVLEQRVAGRFFRSPEVTVGWKREEAGTESVDGPVLGLGWSVPLFSRKQAEKAGASARVTAARARLAIVEREIDSARAAAMATYQGLAVALVRTKDALAGNERMLSGAEAAFLHGEGSLTDLLDTLRLAADAEMARLDLHQAVLAAHRELERLAGFHHVPSPLLDSVPQPSLAEETTP